VWAYSKREIAENIPFGVSLFSCCSITSQFLSYYKLPWQPGGPASPLHGPTSSQLPEGLTSSSLMLIFSD
jgi:hypothetical protein